MTAPAPRGTDPRVDALLAKFHPNPDDDLREFWVKWSAKILAQQEAAGLVTFLPDDATVERVARAMHAVKFDAEGDDFAETWDEDMEIIRQGYLDLARAVLAALAGGAS